MAAGGGGRGPTTWRVWPTYACTVARVWARHPPPKRAGRPPVTAAAASCTAAARLPSVVTAPVDGSNRSTFEDEPADVSPPKISTLEPSRTSDEREIAVGNSVGIKPVVTCVGTGVGRRVVDGAIGTVVRTLGAPVRALPPDRDNSTTISTTKSVATATVRASRIWRRRRRACEGGRYNIMLSGAGESG